MTTLLSAKQRWRSRILAARRDRPESERAAARERTSVHLLTEVDTLVARSSGRSPTICLYLPLASEPLDPALPGRLASLGCRVLVPVTTPGLPLDWVELPADLPPAQSVSSTRGALGIVQLSGPRLGADALTSADLIVVPALAVDRHGVRLGRGGGFYDRSLALLPGGFPGRIVAVVFDDELVAELPHDGHDIPVSGAITPGGGFHGAGPAPGQVARNGPRGASSN